MPQLLSQDEMSRSYERMVRATINMSSNFQISRSREFKEFHSAFGNNSVEFLLREIASRPSMTALLMLQNVTGENPVPEKLSGNVGEAAKAWIKWGLRNKGKL